MSGTSKAILSICVLLLAGLVLYYGMVPVSNQQVAVGDLPPRSEVAEVRMYSRDLDAAAAALGIAPPIVEFAEELVVVEQPVDEQEVTEVVKVAAPQLVEDAAPEKPTKKEQVFYTVVSGDTLGGIAHKLLGSSRHASKIAALNNIEDPRTMQLGKTLRIPDVSTQTEKPVISKPAIPANATTHVILDGETLSDIASDYLGSPHKWMEIWEANKTRISNPDRLKVGVSIVIP
jgi:nucleoid-associated protein YgaU